uniref:Uncharacterized protein n=1 Tax=Chromera velia CCMP2878 TaxID=1169474 RepID=A0A0G4HA64_9ALVE|mmetsp:Transcript_34329/g.67849  ORF Transcript_34329/g.67849 Transcript_34329/m.67849 type:complete len:216 (+) Transcript_34329:240-887(+)|eukprot:Cvel_25606.t1-p1 / transcript=Cvel_25606.t1 / gene=Cvel_25606 / organism=Chromera_velia_CCMP2878 / gene_product=hypothetical protein / transcript_product=hypothetical protein / location=Cvel_scaffold2923:20263-20907(+) / protein_length=215 / sequence_SO=supercontig / SO=protein_coding / is_pseudo=false
METTEFTLSDDTPPRGPTNTASVFRGRSVGVLPHSELYEACQQWVLGLPAPLGWSLSGVEQWSGASHGEDISGERVLRRPLEEKCFTGSEEAEQSAAAGENQATSGFTTTQGRTGRLDHLPNSQRVESAGGASVKGETALIPSGLQVLGFGDRYTLPAFFDQIHRGSEDFRTSHAEWARRVKHSHLLALSPALQQALEGVELFGQVCLGEKSEEF